LGFLGEYCKITVIKFSIPYKLVQYNTQTTHCCVESSKVASFPYTAVRCISILLIKREDNTRGDPKITRIFFLEGRGAVLPIFSVSKNEEGP
jgi:hypothetical protein